MARRLRAAATLTLSRAGDSVGHPGETAPMSKTYYVYLMASKRNGTLYAGVTNDLARRAMEHREGLVPGFTKQHDVKLLVYYEAFDSIHDAIHRESQIKKYKREWKLNLIQQSNAEWRDLAEGL